MASGSAYSITCGLEHHLWLKKRPSYPRRNRDELILAEENLHLIRSRELRQIDRPTVSNQPDRLLIYCH